MCPDCVSEEFAITREIDSSIESLKNVKVMCSKKVRMCVAELSA